MSLEQYKNKNRGELWDVVVIQAEVIAELEKERDEREKSLKKLLYCCYGLSTEYAQNNHGEVQEWLRHVDAAYQALKEKG